MSRPNRVTSLLRAPAAGFSVVVDADDELPAMLRFRTGALGLAPPAGSVGHAFATRSVPGRPAMSRPT